MSTNTPEEARRERAYELLERSRELLRESEEEQAMADGWLREHRQLTDQAGAILTRANEIRSRADACLSRSREKTEEAAKLHEQVRALGFSEKKAEE